MFWQNVHNFSSSPTNYTLHDIKRRPDGEDDIFFAFQRTSATGTWLYRDLQAESEIRYSSDHRTWNV